MARWVTSPQVSVLLFFTLVCTPGFGSETRIPSNRSGETRSDWLGELLDTMVGAATNSGWTVTRRSLSAMQLAKSVAVIGAEARARAALSGLEEAHSVEWSPDGFEGSIALHIHRFRDAPAARRYHGFAQELLRKQDDLWASPDGPYQVLETRTGPVPALPEIHQAVRIDKRLQPRLADAPVTVTTFLVSHDTLCLEISWFGLPVDESWTWNVVRQVLTAMR